ncbi:MAG: hypothetical protein QOD57_4104 [Actinomycetota bacterium]|jgi:hypothetical protein|nr:hypothetical protein [Actinomycetota bacterium]
METLFGIVIGYVLRGTTGSQGFSEVLEQSKAVTESDEFRGLVRAMRHHGVTVLHDLSVTLAQRAEGFAGLLEPEPLPDPPNPWAHWGMSPGGKEGPD